VSLVDVDRGATVDNLEGFPRPSGIDLEKDAGDLGVADVMKDDPAGLLEPGDRGRVGASVDVEEALRAVAEPEAGVAMRGHLEPPVLRAREPPMFSPRR
jgi:hypothetical protein